MKKLIIILLAFVMVFSNVVPAMAAEQEHEHTVPVVVKKDKRERVIIEVDTIADVWKFYDSPEHDDSKVYSFNIKYYPITRAVCPSCGRAAWSGDNYGIDELNPYPQQCPNGGGGMGNDMAIVNFYHYREYCRLCGYEIVHDQYFFIINCEYLGDHAFEAWDGQRVQDGYDRHEDKSFWYAVPAMYH